MAVRLLHSVKGAADVLDHLFPLFSAQQKQKFTADIGCDIHILGKDFPAVILKYREILIAAVMLDRKRLLIGSFDSLGTMLRCSAENAHRYMDRILQQLYQVFAQFFQTGNLAGAILQPQDNILVGKGVIHIKKMLICSVKDFRTDIFHNGMTECQVGFPVPHRGIGAVQFQGEYQEPVCAFQLCLLFQHGEFLRLAVA